MSLIEVKQSRALRRRSYKENYRTRRVQITGKKAFLKRSAAWFEVKIQIWMNGFLHTIKMILEIIRLIPRWIVEQLYFCPMRGQKSTPSQEFLITGHRGAPVQKPENTLESLALAMEQGANALEVDLCITKDNEVVVWHDWDTDSLIAIVRQMGLEPAVKYRPFVPMDGFMRKSLPDLTLEELRANYGYCLRKSRPVKLNYTIPTLRELMEWAERQSGLHVIFLDVKIPEDGGRFTGIMADVLSSLIREVRPAYRIIMLSPYKTILTGLKERLTETDFSFDVILPQLISINPEEYSAVKNAQRFNNRVASVGRPASIGLAPWTTFRRVIDFDLKLMKEADEGQVRVQSLIGWTINNRREMKCLIRKGVSGLLSDYPGRLATIRRRISLSI